MNFEWSITSRIRTRAITDFGVRGEEEEGRGAEQPGRIIGKR